MFSRVLVLGLDAAESSLLFRWMRSGDLPTLSQIAASGTTVSLANPLDTLPGTVWPVLHSGIAPHKVGHYFSHDQLHTGEARLRRFRADDVDTETYYWSRASRAGLRVAVVDAVHSFRSPGLNGIQLVQWGLHDRVFEIGSEPPDLLTEIEGRHGPYPARCSDTGYPKTRRGFENLLGDLVAGTRKKTEVVLDLLERESWDLFSATYSETHCAGHQFWHFHDPAHPDHDAGAPERLRGALRTVYREVDRALGKVIDAAAAEVVVIVTSHGMGPLVGGYNLLPEVLVRLGMGSDRGAAYSSRLRGVQNRLKDLTPKHWVPFAQRVSRLGLVRRIQESTGGLVFPLESAHTRAAQVPNNAVGAVRLNLVGREPYGCVMPGAPQEELVAELRAEFLALEQPESGERIVERVRTAEEAFGAVYHPDNPDLLVVFRQDIGRIDRCWSSRVGLVEAPARNARVPRSGDHRGETRVWIAGDGIPSGVDLKPGDIADFVPTVLQLLGVEPQDDLDGRPLEVARVRSY